MKRNLQRPSLHFPLIFFWPNNVCNQEPLYQDTDFVREIYPFVGDVQKRLDWKNRKAIQVS